ncbi:MAG: LURP-one-related family protein [Eubacteriales bacterium]|nr:LURP-one-related family protein [Eubacteriales bacterium]
MKLYIMQKVFSWKDKFFIKNEQEKDKYYVEGELFSWGKKLHVYDMNQREVAFISQKVFSFLPRFFVYIDGEQVAEIVKEFTFFKPRYAIEGLSWTINGNFMEHDYEILEKGNPIATIHKEWLTWADTYTIDINNPDKEIMALAVVLAIDCVNAAEAAAAHSGATN